ncbi:MAG: tryptophan 2,3-dioxygenase family protein [Streptosporangiaceae bacterium]
MTAERIAIHDQVSYESYLRLPAILSMQHPLTPRDDRATWAAERFFIVCHQASELWLAQILVDLREAGDHAELGDWACARTTLERAVSQVGLLGAQLSQLAFLPRDSFMRFRLTLAGASGADSRQFQELLDGPHHPQLRRIRAALDRAPARAGSPASDSRSCGHDQCGVAQALDALIAGIVRWRELHADIAGGLIDNLPGTGGTDGVAFLRRQIAEAASDWAHHLASDLI